MKAIVEIKGHQFIVEEGSIFDVDKIDLVKDKAEFKNVMLVENSGKVQIGAPYVKGASIKVEELETFKGEKLVVFKFKRKTGYKKKQGHRQTFTRLRVKSIDIK